MATSSSRDSGIDWFVGLAGFMAAFVIAGLLQGVRTDVGSTNVALLLAALVVCAGVIGRRRGALTTALGAALSFNFFHTVPIHSLRIASARDIVTVVLLLVVGLAVGELSRRSQAAVSSTRVDRTELGVLHANAELAASRPGEADLIFHATAAVAQLLGADSVVFEPHPNAVGIPSRHITHQGTLEGIALRATPEGYDLGSEPLSIRVADGSVLHGHMVVTPQAGHPVTLHARTGSIIVVDHLATALSVISRSAGQVRVR